MQPAPLLIAASSTLESQTFHVNPTQSRSGECATRGHYIQASGLSFCGDGLNSVSAPDLALIVRVGKNGKFLGSGQLRVRLVMTVGGGLVEGFSDARPPRTEMLTCCLAKFLWKVMSSRPCSMYQPITLSSKP